MFVVVQCFVAGSGQVDVCMQPPVFASALAYISVCALQCCRWCDRQRKEAVRASSHGRIKSQFVPHRIRSDSFTLTNIQKYI